MFENIYHLAGSLLFVVMAVAIVLLSRRLLKENLNLAKMLAEVNDDRASLVDVGNRQNNVLNDFKGLSSTLAVVTKDMLHTLDQIAENRPEEDPVHGLARCRMLAQKAIERYEVLYVERGQSDEEETQKEVV